MLNQRIETNILTLVHRLSEQLSGVIDEKYFKRYFHFRSIEINFIFDLFFSSRISLKDICRRLLSVLNYNRICLNLNNLNNENEESLTKKNNLFHQSILFSVPCSLPIKVLVEQIEIHLRSPRY